MNDPKVKVEWRCKGSHKKCESRNWRLYKEMSASVAKDFMESQAPNSRCFEYRIKP